ncbi:DUF3000 domain-containing protein [Jiangella gansuensis]|uniref:DUF3000 domain-containing protein n=1 Tax=Jiangella gansuensis TaxID=281473 RepID=UPI0004ADEAC4|nr:DUF3000 domain-containing protein [Jiangella gansuensis]
MARSTEGIQPGVPAVFERAVESLHAARFRPEVHLEKTAAPKRLAPHTHALSADVVVDEADDDATATGRLVLLYDPAGQEAWHGEFRLVTYLRANLEPEMGSDPLLLAVGWTWMIDALGARLAPYTAASGTVTRVASEGFGGMAGELASAEIEIRASWTPLEPDLTPHALAWGDALTTAAGLEPLPTGVVAIPSTRRRRSR